MTWLIGLAAFAFGFYVGMTVEQKILLDFFVKQARKNPELRAALKELQNRRPA